MPDEKKPWEQSYPADTATEKKPWEENYSGGGKSEYEKYLSGEKTFDQDLKAAAPVEDNVMSMVDRLPEMPGNHESKKQIIKDLIKNGGTKEQVVQTMETLRGAHPHQEGGTKYYMKDGVAYPLKNNEAPPPDYHVASLFGSKADAKDDNFATDVFKHAYNILPNLAEDLIDVVQLGYEGITDKHSENLQSLKNAANSLKLEADQDLEGGILNKIHSLDDLSWKNLDLSPEKIWGTALQLGQVVGEIAAPAGIISEGIKGSKWAYKIGKNGEKVLSTAGKWATAGTTSFLVNQGEVADAAEKAGLKGREKAAFVLAVGSAMSAFDVELGLGTKVTDLMASKAINKEGTEKLIGEALKKNLVKDAEGNITKESLDAAMADVVKEYPLKASQWFKETIKTNNKEALNEIGQEFVQKAGQQLFDKMKGEKKFGTETFSEQSIIDYLSAGVDAWVGGTPIASVTGRHEAKIKQENEKSKNIFRAVQQGDEAVKNLKDSVFAAKENGSLTDNEANDALTMINAYKDYNDRVSSLNLNDEQKREVFDLSFQKQNLETRLAQEKHPEKLDPIELAKYKGVEKQADDLQKRINEIVVASQVKQETTVADKTVDDVLKKEEEPLAKKEKAKPSTKPLSPLEALKEKYKAEERKKETRTYEQVPIEEFNKKGFNSRDKHAIVSEYLNRQPGKIAEGKIAKRDFTYQKPNSVFEAELNDGKKIQFSSSQQRDDAWKNGHLDNALDETVMKEGKNGYMELDRSKLEGKPIALKAYTINNDGRERNVIKIYNPQNGKFIAWAKETHKGKNDFTHEEKNGPGGLIDIERTIEQPPSAPTQETTPTEPTPTTPIDIEPKVEKKALPKPEFNLTFITEEKVLKSPMGKEAKKTPYGETVEVETNVGKKQAKLKAELERLKKLTNCIWG